MSGATVAPHRPSADRRKPQLAGRTPLLGFRHIAGITLPPVRDNLRQHNNLCRRDFGDGNRVIQLQAYRGELMFTGPWPENWPYLGVSR